MNPAVALHRINARPLVTLSVIVLGLVVLWPPVRAEALETRVFDDVVVERGTHRDHASTTFGDVTVDGPITGDVHSAFGDVVVRAPVGGDVNAGFGDVHVREPVGGAVDAGFGDVYVDSRVSGVDVEHGEVYLRPDAYVTGSVRSGGEIHESPGFVVRGSTGVGMMPELGSGRDGDLLGFVGWFFAAAGFAACVVLAAVLAPRSLTAAARRAEEMPGRSLLAGLVSIPAVIVLSVALAVSVIGTPLLLLIAPAYLAFVFYGALVAAFLVGRKAVFAAGRYRSGNVVAAVVGALLVAATALIPLVGDILLFALVLLGTGAAILALISHRRAPRTNYPSYEAYVHDRRDA